MISVAGIDGKKPIERPRRSGGRAAVSDFARHVDAGAEAPVAVGSAGALSGVAGLDALLGIQEVGDDDGERRRGTCRYGEELLDRLEQLRYRLLAGAVPLDELKILAQTLRAQQRRSGDEALDAVIADIELRVEVEIAKLHATR